MKRLLVFVFAVALLGSCAKNGEYENYHPNGKLSDWILYENDLDELLYLEIFFENGWSCMQKGMIHLEI